MSQERDKFEAWADRELPYPLTRQDDDYVSLAVQCAWAGWLASRRAALEEGAQVAKQKAESITRVNAYRGKLDVASLHAVNMVSEVEDAIRKLGEGA